MAPAERLRRDLKRHQRGAFVMAAVAIIVAAVLVPKGDELLLIHVKNYDIERARNVLASGASSGVSTVSSVVAHGELYLLEGRVDEALVELEGYVDDHPDNVAAWQRLAKLYEHAQRFQDQVRALAEVYRLQPTTERARELAILNRWAGDELAEASLLSDIVERGTGDAGEHLRRARLEAALGRAPVALATLDRLKSLAADSFDYPALELYASLHLDVHGPAGLASRLHGLPIVRQEPDAVARLATVLRGWDKPEAAVALFAIPDGVDSDGTRLAMRARLAKDTSLADEVVRELVAADAVTPLSPDAVEASVQLALSVNDYDSVLAILGNPASVAKPEVAGLAIGHAVAHGARDKAHALVARLGDEGLADSPMLALELAAERRDAARAQHWIARMEQSGVLTPEQAVAIAEFEVTLGSPASAFTRMAAVIAAGHAPPWAFQRFGGLATEFAREPEALGVLAARAATSPDAARAWASLSIGAGTLEAVDGWVESVTDARFADTLRDTYYLLADAGHTRRAAIAASRLDIVRGSPADALLHAQALMADGRAHEALGPLRRADLSRPDVQLLYDGALHRALLDGSDVAREARTAFTARLEQSGLDLQHRQMLIEGLWLLGERASLLPSIASVASNDLGRWLSPLVEAARAADKPNEAVGILVRALDAHAAPALTATARMDVVRALIDLEGPDEVVLPELKRLAAETGDTWIYAYDTRLERGERREERIALWRAVGHRQDLAVELRRAAAARLVDLDARQEAGSVLRALAASAPPTHADVQQAVAVAHGRIDGELRAWLGERLDAAPMAERAGWMLHLMNAGGASDAAAALNSVPADAPPELVRTWIDAHRATGDQQGLRHAFTEVLSVVSETKHQGIDAAVLRHLGQVALAEGLNDLAEPVYVELAKLAPDDLEAARWLGTLAYYGGATARARVQLDRYAAGGGRESEPLFQLGEVMRAARDAVAARELYERAYEFLPTSNLSASQQVLRANLLVRLGRRSEAVQAFDAYLRQVPGQGHVRADYAAALLQWRHFDEAWEVLGGDEGVERSLNASAASASFVGPPAIDDGSGRRLDLLRVQWLDFEGRYGDALRLLDVLATEYPRDPDVLVARGSFASSRGRVGDADRLYTAAELAAPERADISELIEDIARQRTPSVALGAEHRAIGSQWSATSQSASVGGRVRTYTPVKFTAEAMHVSAPAVRRTDGRIVALDAMLRRVEIMATVPFAQTTSLTLGGIGVSDRTPGAFATLTRQDLRGLSTVTIEANRPFWEFAEAAADEGRRDRFGIQRYWRFSADTAAWAATDWSRYRLGSGASASSTLLTFGIIRTVRHQAPTLTVQYGLDKEHVRRATRVTTEEGLSFAPVPLSSREVHLFGLVTKFPIRRVWEVDASGGYTADRFGGHGTFLTARMTPRPSARAGLELWGERRLFSLVTTQQATRVGASLVVRMP